MDLMTHLVYEDIFDQIEKSGLTLPLSCLGDYDLLNQFDNFLNKKIRKYGLTNIQKHKPLILCLYDLEIFWALSNEDKAVQEFETRLQNWEKSDKGKFLYNFSYFISSPSDSIIKNKSYTNFFDYSKFWDELAK